MITLGIIQLCLTIGILLLTRLFDLRKDRRLTRAGWALIVFACISLSLGIGQLFLSAHQAKLAKFQFNTGDIHIDLYAQYWTYESDAVVLSHAPEALLTDYAYVGNYTTRFDFSRVPTTRRPSGYRSLPISTVVYHSVNLCKDSRFERDRKSPFKYLWDIDGKSIRFTIPTQKFKNLDDSHKWRFTVEVRIADLVIEKNFGEDGKVEINLEGLGKDDLLNS